MRLNVFVNGTFRYPDYIGHYADAGVLGRFHFAHHYGRRAADLGLPASRMRNHWAKHYLHAAAFRLPSAGLRAQATQTLCDGWQAAVLADWTPCDGLEVVIGGLADRLVARAARDGTPVLGHAVTSHPAVFRERLALARADLGLPPPPRLPGEAARRDREIAGCDAVLVDSRSVADTFIRHGVPARRIAVVRPGFDPHRFHPRDPAVLDPAGFRVVSIGLVTPRKGQHVLLDAWRRFGSRRGAELLLVGSLGPDGRTVLADMPAGVRHIGHVPHVGLREILAHAHCFVLPSVEDGFGQAALEAMACGVPVVLSDAVGAAELVRSGHSGFVIPARDPDALAAVLDQLHRDRELGAAVGAAGACAAAASRGWHAYASAVLALHRHLLARQPVGTAAPWAEDAA